MLKESIIWRSIMFIYKKLIKNKALPPMNNCAHINGDMKTNFVNNGDLKTSFVNSGIMTGNIKIKENSNIRNNSQIKFDEAKEKLFQRFNDRVISNINNKKILNPEDTIALEKKQIKNLFYDVECFLKKSEKSTLNNILKRYLNAWDGAYKNPDFFIKEYYDCLNDLNKLLKPSHK